MPGELYISRIISESIAYAERNREFSVERSPYAIHSEDDIEFVGILKGEAFAYAETQKRTSGTEVYIVVAIGPSVSNQIESYAYSGLELSKYRCFAT